MYIVNEYKIVIFAGFPGIKRIKLRETIKLQNLRKQHNHERDSYNSFFSTFGISTKTWQIDEIVLSWFQEFSQKFKNFRNNFNLFIFRSDLLFLVLSSLFLGLRNLNFRIWTVKWKYKNIVSIHFRGSYPRGG